MPIKITYSLKVHHHESRIFIHFDFNQDLINRVKKLKGVLYSHSHRAWHIPDTDENRAKFKLADRATTSRQSSQQKAPKKISTLSGLF